MHHLLQCILGLHQDIGLEDLVDDFTTFYTAGKVNINVYYSTARQELGESSLRMHRVPLFAVNIDYPQSHKHSFLL